MIKDLETSVQANAEVPNTDYGPIPKGTYNLKLVEVGEWKPKTLKSVKVISFDDKYQKVKGVDGNDIVKVVENLTIYENNLKFEVVEGPFKGRWVFHRVNTHPNIPWSIPNMLAGFGVSSLKLSQISTLKGEVASVNVEIDSYMKKVVDKETGIEEEVPKEFNVIKRFNKAEEKADDLDI